MQVMSDGMPLYYWQGDARPGDTTGAGVNGLHREGRQECTRAERLRQSHVLTSRPRGAQS
jgi:hypothetical protein